MIQRHIEKILLVTGFITMLPGLQFIAPTPYLSANGLTVTEPTGLFFAQHWGLLVFCFGALLVLAAKRPNLRIPVIFAATAEKFGLVILVAANWNNPTILPMVPAAVFDTLCVAIYVYYLMRAKLVSP